MILIPRKLTMLLRKYGMRLWETRTTRTLRRTQRRLQHLEKERLLLMHRWSILDSSLRYQQELREERQQPLPPHLQSLELYLQEREQVQEQEQASLQHLLQALGEATSSPTPISLPSSMLHQQE